MTEEQKEFFQQRRIPYLLKPGSLDDLNEKISTILEQNRNKITEKAM